MLIVVLTNESLKAELLAQGIKENVLVKWIDEPQAFLDFPNANAYMDLLFENNSERISLLSQLQPKPILVNAVITLLDKLPEGFVRFNGWNTFLSRTLIEAAATDEKIRTNASEIFSLFNKKIEWTPDIPGFVSARVIAMIINEAFFALDEEVSTRQDINTAMKLGTNYPYGPFEWAEKIGINKIYELLDCLSKSTKRYEPSSLLKNEVIL